MPSPELGVISEMNNRNTVTANIRFTVKPILSPDNIRSKKTH